MARKSQRKQQGPGPAGDYNPAQRSPTTNHDQADAISNAKAIEKLVAPVFKFPCTTAYSSELEVSSFEDMLVSIAESTIQTTAQDQKYLNYENQIQYSYVPVVRSWDQQPQIQQGEYSTQDQTPFVVWENQTPVKEPFNDIGEVAFESAGQRQGEGYDGELRRGKRQKRGAYEFRCNADFLGALW
jgi:hypothetical protein